MSDPRSISIHIDELVLEGFGHADRDRVAEALASELSRLLMERPIAPNILAEHSVARIDAGSFAMDPGASSAQIGAAIAGAVLGGLSR